MIDPVQPVCRVNSDRNISQPHECRNFWAVEDASVAQHVEVVVEGGPSAYARSFARVALASTQRQSRHRKDAGVNVDGVRSGDSPPTSTSSVHSASAGSAV